MAAFVAILCAAFVCLFALWAAAYCWLRCLDKKAQATRPASLDLPEDL